MGRTRQLLDVLAYLDMSNLLPAFGAECSRRRVGRDPADSRIDPLTEQMDVARTLLAHHPPVPRTHTGDELDLYAAHAELAAQNLYTRYLDLCEEQASRRRLR